MLVMVIARIYNLPVTRVLALRHDKITVTGRGVTLWPKADALRLDKPLEFTFLRRARRSSTHGGTPAVWAFPGRHPDRLLFETA